jgi:hypothetical protein
MRSRTHTAQLSMGAPVTIALAAEDKPGPASFQSLLYSGGVVDRRTAKPPLPEDYVIDLAGMQPAKSIKANLDHDRRQRLGHVTDVINDGKQVSVSGLFSAATPYREEVLNSARAESGAAYPWEVSLEASMSQPQRIAAGKQQIVNGRTIDGPAIVFRKSQLQQLAFVSQGADEGNTVTVAAEAAALKGVSTTMTKFEQWAADLGIDLSERTAEQRANLEAMHKREQDSPPPRAPSDSAYTALLEAERAEAKRHEGINRLTLEASREFRGNDAVCAAIQNMRTEAIEGNVAVAEFELNLLRSTRPHSTKFRTMNQTGTSNDPKVVEAALAMSAGLPDIEKHYKPDVLDAVDRSRMRHFSLQGLMIRAACANGYSASPGERIHDGNLREILEYCFPPVTARLSGAGWSGVNLPNILGDLANKSLLAGYMEEDQTWREFSDVKPVNNFHAHRSYRLLDDLEYDELPPGGEIQHGTLSDEGYTRQAKTYAKMLALPRTDIVNDDLGAYGDLRRRVGMGSARKFNRIWWATFMDNAAFFTTTLVNLIEGSTTNLGLDGVGLEAGVLAYRKLRTPAADGAKRLGVALGPPSKLLVPPELEVIADRLYTSTNVNTGGSATETMVPNNNVFAGKYRPIVQDRLSDDDYTGSSDKAWYLFGKVLMPMVVSFLFGNQTPTVQSAEADFQHLGIMLRGYHDFGCDRSEYLAGVKVKGEA